MERCLVQAVGTGVQVSMPSSGSYLKDLSTYLVLTSGVLGRQYTVGGVGEVYLDGVIEGVLNLCWSMCGNGECLFGMEVLVRWFRQQGMALGCYISYLRYSEVPSRV